jgi:hypothetical protein
MATEFQGSSSRQGRQFAEQCDELLRNYGFELSETLHLRDVGVEVDRVATSARGQRVWFEYKGSVQGSRPGLLRTDTLKKAIANGALLQAVDERSPYIVLTSHLPEAGAGLAMLQTALAAGYLDDVICLYKPGDIARLRAL